MLIERIDRALCCVLCISVVSVSLAGDLNPPAGVVAPTHKTLTQVEPRTPINAATTPGDADSLFQISQPGSYYLTGNITGVAGKHGIEIVVSGVTIDLNGFDLAGAPGMSSLAGVTVTEAGVQNIALINGSVRDWGTWGIDLFTLSAQNCRVADVLVSDSGSGGIGLGTAGTFANCSSNSNSGHGIVAGNACAVTNCSAYANTGKGIEVSPGCTVSGCTAQGNSGIGIDSGQGGTLTDCSAYGNFNIGFRLGNAGMASHCSAFGNIGAGIETGDVSTVSGCTASQNAGDGIFTDDKCTITGCAAYNNSGDGINSGIECTITDCTASQNTGDGIDAGAACTISACAAGTNNGNGIDGRIGSAITGCSATANALDGILMFSDCAVRNNHCDSNGSGAGSGAGIHATGSDNRIDGNNCTDNDRGIDVDLAGNIIIRNTCSSNTTNWDIVANNVVGPILDRTVPASAAILGNSAPSSLGTTEPNANFTY